MADAEAEAQTFRLKFFSDPFDVRDALEQSRNAWRGWGVNDDTCNAAEQVLAEALNNVVEHAHQESGEGTVILSTSPSDTGMLCDIMDDGLPMPDGVLPTGKMADVMVDFDDLPEGGFGWFMIRQMTEELIYARKDGWNHLKFRVPAE